MTSLHVTCLVDAELVLGQLGNRLLHLVSERWVPVDDQLQVTWVHVLDLAEGHHSSVDERVGERVA